MPAKKDPIELFEKHSVNTYDSYALNLYKVYQNTPLKTLNTQFNFLFNFGYPIVKENTQLSCKRVGKIPNWLKAYLGCWRVQHWVDDRYEYCLVKV